MHREDFNSKHRIIGKAASLTVFTLGMAYAVTTALGFLSLKSPQDAIGDPFFTIMEVLIILIAPLMAVCMTAVHYYASPADKIYSFTAVFFMFMMVGISSGVHFVILTASHQIEAAGLTGSPFFFSFRWPSVAYALDILAWDFFFALAILIAAPVFKTGRLEKITRALMTLCGFLSLVGLIGAPLGNMQVRNVGIIGYGVIAPVVFLLISILLGSDKRSRI